MQGLVPLGQAYSACAITFVPALIVKGTGVGIGAKSAVTLCDEVNGNVNVQVYGGEVVPMLAHAPPHCRNSDPFGLVEEAVAFGVAVNVTDVIELGYVPVQVPVG